MTEIVLRSLCVAVGFALGWIMRGDDPRDERGRFARKKWWRR